MKDGLAKANVYLPTSRPYSSQEYAEMVLFGGFPEIFNRFAGAKKLSLDLVSHFKKIIWMKKNGLARGVEHRIAQFHDEPGLVALSVVPQKDMDGNFGSSGVGKSFFDEGAALAKALGETVERMSLFSFSPPNAVTASPKDLGDTAVSLDELSGVNTATRARIEKSDSFRKYHPQAALSFKEQSEFRWTRANSFLDDKSAYIPLQLVSLAYSPTNHKEPLLRFLLSTGAAAGKTLDDAILSGILEVVERDAYMITWLNQLAPELLDFEDAPSAKLRMIARAFKRHRLELYLVCLPTDINVPAFLGIAIDRTGIGPAVTVGTKAGFDINDIVDGVAADAIYLRTLMRKRGASDELLRHGHIALKTRVFWWWPRERIKDIEILIRGERKPLAYFEDRFSSALSLDSTAARLNFLKNKLEELKLSTYWVDITRDDLKPLNIPAVVVSIPKMQPLYVDECFPYTDGERLRSVPIKFGFIPTENPPLYSHPFA
ncbi:MAG: Bacteriocin biosynthesis cyclodehydratase domain protein [Parcubacteria group bacterium GW2011_GWA1_51_12]|nr:MAG: Bacteriocin biosynthesis cyclodehydratase domain protein [Parcubacteria group bacterium GW2011_GWA1_51_12]